MTDSISILSVTDRVTDANGVPVSGAVLNFYEAETSTPRVVYADKDLSVPLGSTVYCDSAGYPVTAEGGTTKTGIFTGLGACKVIITDADDVAIITRDNEPGALDTSGFSGSGEVDQSVPVVAKSASYTIVEADNGKLFDVNCTGGDATMTLPSAVDAGDGYYVGIRHNGTANAVILETVSSQTIRHFGAATEALSLTGLGEVVWLASNGAAWVVDKHVPALLNSSPGIILVTDRLSAPPVSPDPGARYILGSSPSGAWSAFAQYDLVEADGAGGWIKRTPPTDSGWLAFVKDEDRMYQRIGSVWTALSTVPAAQSVMETATAVDQVVTPGQQKFHPLHPKAWGSVNFSGSLLAGSGVGSIADTATGRVTITWSTAFSSAAYGVLCAPVTAADRFTTVRTKLAASVELNAIRRDDGTLVDIDAIDFAAFGDL